MNNTIKHVFFNISNHELTEDQIKEVEDNQLDIVELPADLKRKWGTMNPQNMLDTVNEVIAWIKTNHSEDMEAALVAGYLPAVTLIVDRLYGMAVTPVFSHTDRQSVEEYVDGKVIKKSVFKHEGFYAFPSHSPYTWKPGKWRSFATRNSWC